MPKPNFPCIAILFFFIHFQICNGVSVLGRNSLRTPEIDVFPERVCSKSIEDCLTDQPEMESETSRRVLVMQKKYISYDTLRRDMVPCDKPGASYYECHSGQANTYGRGCEIITRCARDIKN
ncbi:Rapid alkalinization factor [Melia azedarach]|uniref:Rapid alkalinization factor n=2 Tax=Melia azedarach TaxID=155640 RepID=A0ACC1YIN1_MELAZ|nr:Rapid alkalinization factor [Melia azedarach]KAJ4723234.1 Rapid alkalinization factor [Melia azedarach]